MAILLFLTFVYGDMADPQVSIFCVTNVNDYLGIVAEILSAVIGLAVPLALTVIQMIQSRNQTSRLINDFINERVYRTQLLLLLLNIGVIVITSLFNWTMLWIPSVILFAISMFYLVKFVFLIHRYIRDIQFIITAKYIDEIDDFFA